jgi:hypothetical protein
MSFNRENLFDDLIAKRKQLDEQISIMRSEEGRMDVGGPHFNREWGICRRSDYTLPKITGELVDNVIKDCSEVRLKTIIAEGYLTEFRCSDNKDFGFEKIRAKGTDNPMNFTHMRTGQNDDNCLSQNGRGLKGGSASSGTKLTIYTNSNNNDKVKVLADFPKMAAIDDCNESYNPRIFKVSDEEFKAEHRSEFGSTIIIENMRKDLYKQTDEKKITDYLCSSLSEMYTPILREHPEKILSINGVKVLPEKDYFEEPECKPFNISHNIYRIEKSGGEEIIIEEKDNNSTELFVYNKESGHINKMTPKEKKEYGFDKSKSSSIKYNDSFEGYKECIRVKATNVMYHPDFISGNVVMPKSRARLTMSGRRYGNWNKEANNGSGNYIDIDINLGTKKIAGEVGLTWNKEIANREENDIAKALHCIIKERITSKLNCDTSTPANKKLYELAIQNNIDIPHSKLPSGIKQSLENKKTKKTDKPKSSNKIIMVESDSDSEDDNSIIGSSHSSSVKRKESKNNNINTTQSPTQTTDNENIVIQIREKNISNQQNITDIDNNTISSITVVEKEKLVVKEEVFEKEDVIEEEKIEKNLTPNLSKTPEVIRKTLTISQGKETLENIRRNSHGINFDQEITKILIEYHDRCEKSQIQRTLIRIPFNLKCDILMDFINERYRFSNEENEKILCGSELFDVYQKLQE